MTFRRTPLRPTVHVGPARAIPSQDLCERLDRALPYVPAGSQNFARSLVQNHATYNGWTPKQLEHAELLLERAREAYKEQHGAHMSVASRTRVSTDGMKGLARMFKRRKVITLTLEDGKFALRAATSGGGYTLKMEGTFAGNLSATGVLDLRNLYRAALTPLADTIDTLGLSQLLTGTDAE